MLIKGFECVNEGKLHRAIFGSVSRQGAATGGVGEEATDELKLAAYDRLAGLIMKGERRVKHGCFCDIVASNKAKTVVPFETPEVIFVMGDLEGNKVELPESEITPEILAAEKIAKKKKAEQKAKVEKAKKDKK